MGESEHSADAASNDPASAEAQGDVVPGDVVPGDVAPDGSDPVAHEDASGADFAVVDVLDTVTKERDEYLDAMRRLQADFDNYRKRARADTELEVGRATEKVIADLLPVLDSYEMALAHEAEPDASPLAKMHESLLVALEKHGLERLYPLDMPFDPAEADAVIHEEGEGGATTVVQVMRAGYRWRNRVIRAAMVKVRD
jgi:molecular chaperone GrpE